MSTGSNDDTEDDESFDDRFSELKKANQGRNRGWTDDLLDDLIDNPAKTLPALNLGTNNGATVYYDDDGNYIMIDNGTGKIFHTSDRNDPDWKDYFAPNGPPAV